MLKNKKIYIYAIYFPTSNKYYIGQTNNLNKRMFEHLKADTLVGNALRKYNDWQVSILHTRIEKEEINLLEIEGIRNFNCIVPNGYNLTRGGEGRGFPEGELNPMKNPKIVEKVRRAQLGIKKPGVSKALKGNKYAPKKNPAVSKANRKRNKENNPMNNPKARLKQKISCLKTKLTKLEKVGG